MDPQSKLGDDIQDDQLPGTIAFHLETSHAKAAAKDLNLNEMTDQID